MYGYSPRVEKALELHAARESGKAAEWERGPYIEDGKIIIPSPYYNKRAVDLWKSWGFRYSVHVWEKPMGPEFPESEWLEWARDQYALLYPDWKRPAPERITITQDCLRCDCQFDAEDEVQVLCPACEEEQQDWACRRDVIEQPAIQFV